jgi:hypothetical protein
VRTDLDLALTLAHDLTFPMYSFIGAGAFAQVGRKRAAGTRGAPTPARGPRGPPGCSPCAPRSAAAGARLGCRSRCPSASAPTPIPAAPQVHRAILRGATPVAVKLLCSPALLPDGAPSPHAAALLDELRIMSRVPVHPNIVTCFGGCDQPPELFIVEVRAPQGGRGRRFCRPEGAAWRLPRGSCASRAPPRVLGPLLSPPAAAPAD